MIDVVAELSKTVEDRVRRAIAAERERCAKIAEGMPDRILVMYDRPGSPPGNTYAHIIGKNIIAAAIRKPLTELD